MSDNIDDATPTWYDIDSAENGFPNGNFDQPVFVQGDLKTYGTVYVGFVGTGGAYWKGTPPRISDQAEPVKNIQKKLDASQATPTPSYSIPNSKRGPAFPKQEPLHPTTLLPRVPQCEFSLPSTDRRRQDLAQKSYCCAQPD